MSCNLAKLDPSRQRTGIGKGNKATDIEAVGQELFFSKGYGLNLIVQLTLIGH